MALSYISTSRADSKERFRQSRRSRSGVTLVSITSTRRPITRRTSRSGRARLWKRSRTLKGSTARLGIVTPDNFVTLHDDVFGPGGGAYERFCWIKAALDNRTKLSE